MMEAFYHNWFEEGQAPAHALREAKLALRRGEIELGSARGVGVVTGGKAVPAAVESGHPFYWAPFIHIGLGR